MSGMLQELNQGITETGVQKSPLEVFSQSDDHTLHNILAAVQVIEDEPERFEMFHGLAAALADSKDNQVKTILTQVAEIADSFLDQGFQARAQRDLAVVMARNGMSELAVEKAQTIVDPSLRAEALADVAEALSKAGENGQAWSLLTQAFAALKSIENETVYAQALDRLAKSVSQSFEGEQAQEILTSLIASIETLPREGTRARALAALAPYLSRSLLEQALAAARKMKSASAQARALAGIAQFLPEAGRSQAIQQALKTAQLIRSKTRRAEVLEELVTSMPVPKRMEILKEIQILQNGGDTPEKPAPPEKENPGSIEISTNTLSDRWSEKDYLEFSDYADALADFILDERTEKPLTIAVDAAWGMGKTTLMHMIESRLNRRSAQTVWFNAWKYNREESLWAALALEILIQVRKRLRLGEQLKLWFKLNWERLDWELLLDRLLKSSFYTLWILAVGAAIVFLGLSWLGIKQQETFERLALYIQLVGPLGIIAPLFSAGKEALDHVTGPFDLKIAEFIREPDYKERAGFINQFEEDFRRVIEAVTENEHGQHPFVVFIDDLDRCAPSKPAEIVEAINFLLDAPSCVFVIGMESRTVAGSIEVKYQDLKDHMAGIPDPGGLTLGQRFLEKIVQINFRIPRATPQAVALFIDWNLDGLGERKAAESEQQAVAEAQVLIQAEQEQGKSLDQAANAVQAARPELSKAISAAGREMRRRSFTDSPEVRRAIQEAVPYLGYNPRKIKRFINLFRLQAFIANRRGLLDQGVIQLNLLAKWVIVATRWPDVVDAMAISPGFIQRLLQAHALQERLLKGEIEPEREKKTHAELEGLLTEPLIRRFYEAEDLIQLLRAMKSLKTEALPYLHLVRMAGG